MAAIRSTRPEPGPVRPATSRIRTPLFILGVGLALLAFLAMFAFGILFANRSQVAGQVQVVVAARDIEPREPITPDMITLAKVPSTTLPPHAIVNSGELAGFSALVTIYKGAVVTSNVVTSNPDQIAGGAASFLPIPQGYVAMTLPTGEQQGVAGYIAQGDYMNVIATVNTGLFSTNSPRTVARTVFTSLYVIRVGPPSLAPKQGQAQGIASSLTVVMSLCDAQFMDWLISNASLKYVLLSYKDYSPKSLVAPDPGCPSVNEPGVVGPSQVDARWAFTKS